MAGRGLLGQLLSFALETATGRPNPEPELEDCGDELEDGIRCERPRDHFGPHRARGEEWTDGEDDDELDDDDDIDDDVEEAIEEYEAFHWGNAPDAVVPVEVPDPPRTLVLIGDLEGVIYRTSKGGAKRESWIHFHDEGEPPKLAYDPKTGQLYILGGKYRIEPEGIVD